MEKNIKINWVKNNWFKIGILIILVIIAVSVFKMSELKTQESLTLEQQKCSEAGVKNDKQLQDSFSYSNLNTRSYLGYYYNPRLNTCVGTYSFSNKDQGGVYGTDYIDEGYGIYDLYNKINILTCTDYFNRQWDIQHKVYDDITLIENKNGIYSGNDINKTGKNWNICAEPFKELTGGKFWYLPN